MIWKGTRMSMTDSFTSVISSPITPIWCVRTTRRIHPRCVEESKDCKWNTANTIRHERATFLQKKFRNTFTASSSSNSAGAGGTRRAFIAV